jgi:colanic acid/amylovoran biosynthesis glycosyltransferase
VRKLKVCFILASFPSVSETFVLRQMTGLVAQGHEIMIYAGMRGDERTAHEALLRKGLLSRARFYHDKPAARWRRLLKGIWLFLKMLGRAPGVAFAAVNVFRYGREASSFNLLFKAHAFLEAGDFDVILAHFGQNGLVGLQMKELGALKGKLVTVFHAVDLTAFVRREGADVYEQLFKKIDLALAISVHAKDRLVSLGCSLPKIRIHRIGVDVARAPAVPSPFGGPAVKLLSVSRCVEKKGLADALDAVAILCREKGAYEYIIVGDGPLRPALEERARALGIDQHVHFLGAQTTERVRSLMAGADILLAPSVIAANGDEEGIPVVLMEAMAAGLVVVSTITGGVGELLQDGVTGFAAPPHDPRALAETIAWMPGNRAAVMAVTARARAFVEEHHDAHKLDQQLDALLTEVVDGRC